MGQTMSDLSDSAHSDLAQSEEEEYLFDSRHADDIVRIAFYHRQDFDLAVIWLNLRDHVDVKTSIPRPFPRSFTNDIGILDTLLLEILHEICLQMDITSLFQFRQISMRAREVVGTLNEYRSVGDHALGTLRVVLRTGIASYYTIRDLYRVLCTRDCTLCGAFGGFHLPPHVHEVLLLVHPVTDGPAASRHPGPRAVGADPGIDPRVDDRSWDIFAGRETLRSADVSRCSGMLPRCWGNPEGYKRLGNMISMGAMVESPLYRFMASTALPYLDLTNRSNDNDNNSNANGRVECGVCCKGCQIALKKRRDRVYSREGFLEHFRRCRQAQKLWEASCEGKKDVGFFEERKVVMYS